MQNQKGLFFFQCALACIICTLTFMVCFVWHTSGNVMSRAKKISLILAVAFVVTGLLLTLNFSAYEATARYRSTSSSRISMSANMEVYSDRACTQSLTSIEWGTVTSGNSVRKTVYIKNQGRYPLTLSLVTTNWNPSNAQGFIIVDWNHEGATLAAGRTMWATLTLSASPSASSFTIFGFDVVIIGERYRNYSWTKSASAYLWSFNESSRIFSFQV